MDLFLIFIEMKITLKLKYPRVSLYLGNTKQVFKGSRVSKLQVARFKFESALVDIANAQSPEKRGERRLSGSEIVVKGSPKEGFKTSDFGLRSVTEKSETAIESGARNFVSVLGTLNRGFSKVASF